MPQELSLVRRSGTVWPFNRKKAVKQLKKLRKNEVMRLIYIMRDGNPESGLLVEFAALRDFDDRQPSGE
jgi:hypothetical protein